MKTKMTLCLGAWVACLGGSARADEVSIATAPPVVVRTVPMAGSTDVDPALTEMRVTYSKEMQDGSWSWSTWGEENFPKTTGNPRYLEDGRTCVLPVKLEPGKFYAMWLNSENFGNFKDTNGRSAVPYLLTFHTDKTRGGQSLFGAVTEVILKSPEGRVAELLDLDTGERATSINFGENDRVTHAWVRDHKLDVLAVVEHGQIAVLCHDMAVLPVKSERWEQATAADLVSDGMLAQMEPNKITAISLATDKTDTWIFRTREAGQGILQIMGQNADPRGVRIRYKLVTRSDGRSGRASDLDSRIAQLAKAGTRVEEAIRVLGEPKEYVWERERFAKDNLPATYILRYDKGVAVVISWGEVVELRSEGSGPGFSYRGQLRLGSSLDEMLKVVGSPSKTVTGQPLSFEKGVLYKDIDGEKGRAYYARPDKQIRCFFLKNRICALYIPLGEEEQEAPAKGGAGGHR
jgi:hypothetical protein